MIKKINNLTFLLLIVFNINIVMAIDRVSGYSFKITESKLMPLKSKTERIQVIDPKVVQVKLLNSRELLLSGSEQVGKTEVIIWYTNGKVEHVPIVVKNDISDLRILMKVVDPDGLFRIHEENNTIIITGETESIIQRKQVEELLLNLGYSTEGKEGQPGKSKVVNLISVTGGQQVQIFVQIAEVVRNRPMKYGVSLLDTADKWGMYPSGNGGDASLFNLSPSSLLTRTLPIAQAGGYQLKFNQGGEYLGILSILEENSLARILSQPTLVVESGQTASFLAGGEVPYPQASGDTISTSFKTYGVKLDFSPTVLGGGIIAMRIVPEVSTVDYVNGTKVGSAVVPGLRTRRTATSIRMREGESLVISGLLQDQVMSTVRKIPIFGDIPILGILFRSSEFFSGQTELMIIVTPRIVYPLPPNQAIKLPGQDISEPSMSGAFFMGKLFSREKTVLKLPHGPAGLEMPR